MEETHKHLKLMGVLMLIFGYQKVGGVPIIEQVIKQQTWGICDVNGTGLVRREIRRQARPNIKGIDWVLPPMIVVHF